MTGEVSLVGSVCECSDGRRAIVTETRKLASGLSWVGVGLDDGSLWSSPSPKVLRTATKEDLIEATKRQEMRMRLDGIWPCLPESVDYGLMEFTPDASLVASLEVGRQVQVRRLHFVDELGN